VENLIAEIVDRDEGRLATGTMGTAALEQVLADVGAADVMYDLATRTDFPSWGSQIASGATTIWESWGRDFTMEDESGEIQRIPGSRNMKLLAAISKFLYKDVAGISPGEPGWRRMRVRPALTHRLAHAEARVRTVRGDAAIGWRSDGGELVVELEVPATTTAEIVLPVAADVVVREGDDVLWDGERPAAERPELGNVRRLGESVWLEAGGGAYRFVIRKEP
jgi:alpha-L-rhamnosidase